MLPLSLAFIFAHILAVSGAPKKSYVVTQKYYHKVVRVGGIDVGILLLKDDKHRATPHWVVSVEGESSNDEELVSEKSLGRVLESHDSDDTIKSATMDKTAKKPPPAKKVTKAKTKVNRAVASSAATTTAAVASASAASKSTSSSRRMNTRAASKRGGDGHVSLNDGIGVERKVPSPRPRKRQGDGSVVEVKMLTGTLFMYRGDHPRVEFIRTV